jgi:hypothetical protein
MNFILALVIAVSVLTALLKGYIARAALASEDRPMTIGTASTQTFCSRCNHPMHWKVCGVERDGLPSSCRCRNDAALEEPTE